MWPHQLHRNIKKRPVPLFQELAFCYFLTWFSLIPKLVAFHPFLNLLIGHVEVAFLLVEWGHLRHLVLSQFEVEHLDILQNMLRIGRAGHYAEALLDVPTDDDLCRALAVSLGNLTYNGITQDLTLRVTTSFFPPALLTTPQRFIWTRRICFCSRSMQGHRPCHQWQLPTQLKWRQGTARCMWEYQGSRLTVISYLLRWIKHWSWCFGNRLITVAQSIQKRQLRTTCRAVECFREKAYGVWYQAQPAHLHHRKFASHQPLILF